MVKFLYTEIDVFGIIILFIILCNQIRGTAITIQQKIFNFLLLAIMIVLVFDCGMWIVDGLLFKNAKEFNIFFSTGYYLMNGIAVYLWPMYVESQINNDVKKLKKTAFYCLIPLIVYLVLVLMNIQNEMIFIIDNNNFYHRGAYICIPVIFTIYYLAFATFKIYKKLKIVSDIDEKKQMYYLTAFVIFPTISIFIQMLVVGSSVVWLSVVVSLLIIFINVQNKQILTDPLTGLNNRIQFDKYTSVLIKSAKRQERICLLIIDIDKFKLINDTFGHKEGDRALVNVSKILKKSCKNKKVFISRYGGDEFLIVYKVKEIRQLDDLIKKIYFNLEELNTSEGIAYKIQLSIGKAVWDFEEITSVNDLFIKADNCMYSEKKKKLKSNINIKA